jgi:hypothetical protein
VQLSLLPHGHFEGGKGLLVVTGALLIGRRGQPEILPSAHTDSLDFDANWFREVE